MKFVTINDKLAPLRLLRQVDAITNTELEAFLTREAGIKQAQAAGGERWVEVIDCRRFAGLSEEQREACVRWLGDNLPAVAAVSIGVAFVVPAELHPRATLLCKVLERLAVPVHVGEDLDEALYWALDLVCDEDVVVDAELILGGVDALRPTLD